MDSNLVSINKLQNDIKIMKLMSILLKPEQRKQLKEMEKQLDKIMTQTILFNDRFSDYGWCAYDSMDLTLMERANAAFEESGLEAAEQILINFYKSDVKEVTHWINHSSEAFSIRYSLIQRFFEDHFAERYHASVPLGLIIVDGAVNDFTKSKGFFAEGTSVSAWDCLVGCSDGLTKLKNIYNQKRTRTNTDEITLPYRNGILHGRDLSYANEYVSCKCVLLMFAVADWMKMKNSEDRRKAEYQESINPPSLRESLTRLKENRRAKEEIAAWQRRTVVVGIDIPITGTIEDYIEYPYIVAVVEMLTAWKDSNYGKLSDCLQKMFASSLSEGRRAGECRKMFQTKKFVTFEIIEIEERGCALSKVITKVYWTTDDCKKEAVLKFGCNYESNSESIGLPWRNNGKWVLIPWDVQGLYQ